MLEFKKKIYTDMKITEKKDETLFKNFNYKFSQNFDFLTEIKQI